MTNSTTGLTLIDMNVNDIRAAFQCPLPMALRIRTIVNCILNNSGVRQAIARRESSVFEKQNEPTYNTCL